MKDKEAILKEIKAACESRYDSTRKEAMSSLMLEVLIDIRDSINSLKR